MEDTHNRRREMFLRVQGFGTAHSADFGRNGLGSQLLTELDGIVDQLSTHAATEASGRGTAKQGTTTRAAAREALRDDLEAINRTARAMAEDTPGINDKFRFPRGNNDQNLLSAARAFAADAVPFSAQFIGHEMPADFLTDLATDIANLEAAISHQAGGVGGHVAAGVAIDETVDQGLVIVRKFDAIVRNKYADNPATLAEWTSASHTERAPRRSTPGAPPPGTSPGSTPPSQPTA
jgi:hypothetical protein